MVFDEAYRTIGNQLGSRDYTGALATAYEYERTAPTKRDYGCSLLFQADLQGRGFGDVGCAWSLVNAAAGILRPYPLDYAMLCATSTLLAARSGDPKRCKEWMANFMRTYRRHSQVAWCFPLILSNYALLLRGLCRWPAALRVIETAIRRSEEIRYHPGNETRTRAMALEAAWTAIRCGRPASAAAWLLRSRGDWSNPCWRDLSAAVEAEHKLLHGDLAGASAALPIEPASVFDSGALFVTMARIRIDAARGGSWTQEARQAMRSAVRARQDWAIQPLRQLIDELTSKGGVGIAADG